MRMTATALVDMSPVGQIMLIGLATAGLVLAWAWLRAGRRWGRDWRLGLTLLTLFLTFDLVLFGSFTRLTDSGLGCPDWPGCYGQASPVGASVQIDLAQSTLPSGPVTRGKAWIEMVHRYMATAVGALILMLAATAWFERLRRDISGRGPSPWWPSCTLAWVAIQGAFGAYTVTMKLFPLIVTLHLLGGLFLLLLLVVQAQQLGWLRASTPLGAADPATRALLLLGGALLCLQLALGGWVSANYAVLACTGFPTCQGSWWPQMRFDQGFELWRELGMTAQGEFVSFAALTAIHYVHRLVAIPVLGVLALLAWRLFAIVRMRALARWIVALLLLQLATGLANVVLDWPLLAALLHTGGAAALVLALGWLAAESCRGASAARSGAPVSRDVLP